MKKTELTTKVMALNLPEDQRNSVVCAMIGHSKIVFLCFGEVSCGRCNHPIGDTLMGSYDLSKCVIVGHDCDNCHSNYKALTWQDKLYVANPFKVEPS